MSKFSEDTWAGPLDVPHHVMTFPALGFEWRDDLELRWAADGDYRQRQPPWICPIEIADPRSRAILRRQAVWIPLQDIRPRDRGEARLLIPRLLTMDPFAPAHELKRSILEFVSTNGFLTRTIKAKHPQAEHGSLTWGESLPAWRDALTVLQALDTLIRESRALERTGAERHRRSLLEWVEFWDDLYMAHVRHPRAHADGYRAEFGGSGRRNIREIATDRVALVQFIRGCVANSLANRLSGAMRVDIDPAASAPGSRFVVGPDSLLSSCFLELAGMLVGRNAYMAHCAVCGQPFVAQRRDAKTCSDSCRARMSYSRRRQTLPEDPAGSRSANRHAKGLR